MNYAERCSELVRHLPAKVVQSFDCVFPDGRKEFSTKQQKVLMIPRPVFDAGLARRAVSAGATLCTRAKVTVLDAAQRRVEVQHLESEEGRSYTGRYVIAADGVGTVAGQAGIGFRRGRFNRAAALMVELDSPEDPISKADIVFEPSLIPWGYFWVFPHGHLINVGVGSLKSTNRSSLRKALEDFIEADPRLRGRKRLRGLGGEIPLRPASRLYGSGVLAVGDAAGLVNPFTGAGIHHAMRSGKVAGRSCVAALRRKSGRCYYGLRMGLSATYLWLHTLSFAAGATLLLSRWLRRPLYTSAIRALMRDRELVYRVGSRMS